LVVLIAGIAVVVMMVAVSAGLAFFAALVAGRSDDAADLELSRRLVPPALDEEPFLAARRFARDPHGRPIAAPHPAEPIHAGRG
jgi:hypothetical protein